MTDTVRTRLDALELATVGLSAAELAVLDGVTPGTATASKAVVLDSSKGISTITSATITTLTAPTIAGDITFADGTTDVDIASHDGTNGLQLGGTLVTALAADLNILDGVTATTAEINAVADASTRIVVSTDAGTLALTKALHANRIVDFNDADGAISLPASAGTGDIYEVWYGTACTAAAITVAAGTDDEFIGFVSGVDTDADTSLHYPALAADDYDTISLAGATTGGNVGDWFRFTDVGAGIWKIEGHVTQSGGSEADPLSDGSITS